MRRIVSILAVLLCPSLALAAAPTLVVGQHAAVDSSGTTITMPLTGVTDGNTIIVGLSQTAGDIDQTAACVEQGTITPFTLAVGPIRTTGANGNRTAYVYYFPNIQTGGTGNTTVLCTLTNGTSITRGQWLEITGAGTTPTFDVASSNTEAADTASHTGASPSMTTSANVFVYSVMACNANATSLTPTASPAFTTLSGDFSATASLSQTYSGATALSSNSVSWGSGTSRTCATASASFVAAAGPTGPPVGTLNLLGAGK